MPPATLPPPSVLFEDEDLLVVNKPSGLNTHSPAPFAGEGIYDWLRHREPRWGNLAILHRLDKETSGVMVFGKTPTANRSLTQQFTRGAVKKKYVLLTHKPPARREFVVDSPILRAHNRYVSGRHGQPAITRFRVRDVEPPKPGYYWLEAEPLTGRTHQIRVHAAQYGCPVLGDTLYGGASFGRVCLHAEELSFSHPTHGRIVRFQANADFLADAPLALRAALLDARDTDAWRVVHGAADGWPGLYVDRLGDYLLSQYEAALTQGQQAELKRLTLHFSCRGAHHKILQRRAAPAGTAPASPQRVLGHSAPERFTIHENGVHFELSFAEGYSVGLFLDQRDNRRRLLTGQAAAGFPLFATARPNPRPPGLPAESGGDRAFRPAILNVFAYTCAFSVCAALAGARTTSVDLSRKYLEWGSRNFRLNNLDPAEHEFLPCDAFDGLRRLEKRKRRYAVILLDPPTFSQSKERGVFRAQKDFPALVRAALPLLEPGGVLFASTNAAGWSPEPFLEGIDAAIRTAKRPVLQRHYAPQPPDFPMTRAEPAYLKTVWLRIG